MSGEVRNFRDLRVWQNAMQLGEEIYRLTWTFPERERYGLGSQIQRSVVSIASNIAEGHGRGHTNDYIRFLSISRGSAAELSTQLEFAARLGYCETSEIATLIARVEDLARQITALRSALESRVSNPRRIADDNPITYS